MGYIEEVEKIDAELSGIYLITNKTNKKHYVGQSIYLRRKLLRHKRNWILKKYDTPLYRAFTKYGIDNFSIDILWSTKTKDYNSIKKILDDLEKKYIKEYKSYGEYNQTTGGDAGIIGYRMTDEQKTKIKKNQPSIINKVYAFDILTKKTYMAINEKYLAINIHGSRDSIAHILGSDKSHIYLNRYILGKSYSELQSNYDKALAEGLLSSTYISKYGKKFTDDEFLNLINKYKDVKDITLSKIAKIENLNKKTLYIYADRFRKRGIELNIKIQNKI